MIQPAAFADRIDRSTGTVEILQRMGRKDGEPRPRVCLCMIVKDEAAVIERLIDSVAEHVDYYVISDTGSSDDTVERIYARFDEHGISGIVIEDEWVDFGHNRTKTLQHARGCADWLLLMDADWTLEVGGDLAVVTLKALTTEDAPDCWLVAAAGGFQMTHKVLLQGDKPWKAVGRIHEIIDCDEPFTERLLPGVTWTHHADSGTRDSRAGRDEEILREELAANPSDSRSTFYLAQTLKDAGRVREAVGYYLDRADLGGWEQETYLSLLYAGRLAAGQPEWEDADRLGLFFRAWGLLPDRLEALYELVSWLRVHGHYEAAWTLLGRPSLERVGRIYEVPVDAVFAEGWIADYGMRHEEAIVAYWVGEYRHCADVCGLLLESDEVPIERKMEAARNLGEAQAALEAVAA